jgi:hypothetical protein
MLSDTEALSKLMSDMLSRQSEVIGEAVAKQLANARSSKSSGRSSRKQSVCF